jgi:hypothetical protein
MRFHPRSILVLLAVAVIAATNFASAASKDEIRSTFTRFINAQNAHDLKEVGNLLGDSPDFLWISQGHVVRKRDAALERFRTLFKGKWRIDPDWSTFQILGLDISTMEVFVHVRTSDDTSAGKAQMNVILVNTAQGWRVQNIFVSSG